MAYDDFHFAYIALTYSMPDFAGAEAYFYLAIENAVAIFLFNTSRTAKLAFL